MCADRRAGRLRARQRGLSLVELMVAMLAALLVSLAATSGAVMFTASQRQGAGTAGAMVGAANVLAAVKQDAAPAGLGFYSDNAVLCDALRASVAGSSTRDLSVASGFAPLEVRRGTGSGTAANYDELEVAYAASVAGGGNVRLRAASTGTGADLDSFLPVAVGDAVLLVTDPAASSPVCLLRTVTAQTAATAAAAQHLDFGATGQHNATPGTWGSFSFSPQTARAVGLGALHWHRYYVQDRTLMLERKVENTTSALLENVEAFRVQLGVSAASGVATHTVTGWVDADATTWSLSRSNVGRVRALRIGVVTRSASKEKGSGTACTATSAAPQLFGTAVALSDADWRCWRYRTATVTVPLRNTVVGLP